MIEIAVEEVMRIHKERWAINKLAFLDIVWTYKGNPIDIPSGLREDFALCGLNNMDFITSNFLPKRSWQKGGYKAFRGRMMGLSERGIVEMGKAMDEVLEFVKHYKENNGYIGGKYVRGEQIKRRWVPLTHCLDAFKNHFIQQAQQRMKEIKRSQTE